MIEATENETFQQLRRRIDHWQNNVSTQTKNVQRRHAFSPVRTRDLQSGATVVKSTGYSVNGRSLRPTARRLALQEIPVNVVSPGPTTRTRKRKREGSTMSKEAKKKKQLVDGEQEEAGERGSGLGMTTRSSAAGTNSETGSQGDFRTHLDFLPPSRPPSQPPSSAAGFKTPILTPAPSSSSRQSSPKKTGKSADRPVKGNEITLAYLAHCEPPVIPYTREKLKKDGIPIPTATEELYEKIRWARACIPKELKASTRPTSYESSMDTPTKSKEQLDPSLILPDPAPYIPRRLLALKDVVDHITEKAILDHESRAHEKEWGAIVSKFLTEMEMQSEGQAVAFNTETISIQPDDFQPLRPDRQPIIKPDTRSEKSGDTQEASRDSLARMVDWCFCLRVERKALQEIKWASARTDSKDRLRSLNQTFSFISDYPIIFEIEVKKTYQAHDPLVQLADWASGGLLKKRAMGWDRSMPMPGIAVEGHLWQLYLFFESGSSLIMMGPMEFGNTASLEGTWLIMHRLHILMQWGTVGAYFHWFDDQILQPARLMIGKGDKAGGGPNSIDPLDHQMPSHLPLGKKKKAPKGPGKK